MEEVKVTFRVLGTENTNYWFIWQH